MPVSQGAASASAWVMYVRRETRLTEVGDDCDELHAPGIAIPGDRLGYMGGERGKGGKEAVMQAGRRAGS